LVKKVIVRVKRPRELIIIGAGGHGRVVADIAKRMGKYPAINFVDDADIKRVANIPVIGTFKDLLSNDNWLKTHDVFIAIGDYKKRKQLTEQLESLNATIPKLIHPSAVIAEDVAVGHGTAVMANAVINCGSKIGKGVIINTAATVDHDNIIGDYVHISPGSHLAGTVTVSEGTWIGIGATVINNLEITHDCMIGAGAVVVRSLIEPGTYAGVPARRL
jgi:sugar O-acyltransferase (sialic acid O-acetyltransferase NeuD family)